MMKFRFYLLGNKGFEVLSKVLEKYGSECVENVIIANDKNILDDFSSKLEELCIRNDLKYFSRNDIVDNNVSYVFAFAIGWRWIIDISKVKNLIILHDSILPRYRGFNPLVSALINGDSEIGVTALYASEKYDEGDIIFQSKQNISHPIKIDDAINIISKSYSELVVKVIGSILEGKELPRITQNHFEASYSLWRDDQDYYINWSWENSKILRFIYATGLPYNGAKSIINNQVIRIISAEVYNDVRIENRTHGKVIFIENTKPIVVCGKGLLKIHEMETVCDNKKFILKKFRVRFQ